MSDGNKLLSRINRIGRPRIRKNLTAKCRLFHVRLDSNGNDEGGAYWGGPDNLFACIGNGFEIYVRGKNRKAVLKDILVEYPDLKIRPN